MTDDPGREAGDERPQERLGFLRPRDRHFDPYRSRRVGRLRLVLPLGAALVLALLVLWPKLQPSRIKKMVVANIPNLVIQNLHFTGLDSKNEPYSLTAARATRPAGLKNVYDFVQPRGEITLLSGAWIAGRADQGRYDPDTRHLWLGGHVQFFHDKGYQFDAREVQVDLNRDDAWSDQPVRVQGAFGVIRGQGFRLLNAGTEIVVGGPATADLDLRAGPGSDKPAQSRK